MKYKIKKEYIKTNSIGFIIVGIIVSGWFVFSAVTFPSNEVSYSNTESGLVSTNVQGAIYELYKDCKGIITAGGKDFEPVTSGDGLYKDEYEEGKYTYKGANPNNYITFNNEKAGWRIISINSYGTIKIMRNESIGNRAWDSSSNNWASPADLNTYLNGTYYNGLTSIAKSQIVVKDWSVGGVIRDNNDLANQINDENSSEWNGKVALPTVSEYIRSNSNQTSCGTFSKNNDNHTSCLNTNWMDNNDNWWTLSPDSDRSNNVLVVGLNGFISSYNLPGNYTNAVRPSVYLSSDIKITGGNGSSSSPYTIS